LSSVFQLIVLIYVIVLKIQIVKFVKFHVTIGVVSYKSGLVCKFVFPKATRGFEPIGYRGALLSTLLHATVYKFIHNLLNVLVQIANKMGLQKKIPQDVIPRFAGVCWPTGSPEFSPPDFLPLGAYISEVNDTRPGTLDSLKTRAGT
jgi:hypothetical protein